MQVGMKAPVSVVGACCYFCCPYQVWAVILCFFVGRLGLNLKVQNLVTAGDCI